MKAFDPIERARRADAQKAAKAKAALLAAQPPSKKPLRAQMRAPAATDTSTLRPLSAAEPAHLSLHPSSAFTPPVVTSSGGASRIASATAHVPVPPPQSQLESSEGEQDDEFDELSVSGELQVQDARDLSDGDDDELSVNSEEEREMDRRLEGEYEVVMPSAERAARRT